MSNMNLIKNISLQSLYKNYIYFWRYIEKARIWTHTLWMLGLWTLGLWAIRPWTPGPLDSGQLDFWTLDALILGDSFCSVSVRCIFVRFLLDFAKFPKNSKEVASPKQYLCWKRIYHQDVADQEKWWSPRRSY